MIILGLNKAASLRYAAKHKLGGANEIPDFLVVNRMTAKVIPERDLLYSVEFRDQNEANLFELAFKSSLLPRR